MKTLFYLLLLLILTTSCEELISPDIDTQTTMLVFEGEITNQDTFQYVRIKRSLDFNSSASFESVTGFTVYIEDKEGETYPLTETSTGYYQTDNKVKGELYHQYRLVAYDTAMRQYTSTYQKLGSSPDIRYLSGKYKTITSIVKDASSSYYEETSDGIQVMVSSNATDSNLYFRYTFNVAYQSTQTYPSGMSSVIYYICRPSSSFIYGNVVTASAKNYDDYYIKNLPLYFFSTERMNSRFVIYDFEYDESGASKFDEDEIITKGHGFQIQVQQRSLSEDGYVFWKAVYDQQYASGNLFDPIETQITGNMSCTDDSTELVFGYFGASAITTLNQYFKLNSNNQVITETLSSFPMLDSTEYSTTIPSYWVSD